MSRALALRIYILIYNKINVNLLLLAFNCKLNKLLKIKFIFTIIAFNI
jgi:hypothetical protein